jgi:hypothetical protein
MLDRYQLVGRCKVEAGLHRVVTEEVLQLVILSASEGPLDLPNPYPHRSLLNLD